MFRLFLGLVLATLPVTALGHEFPLATGAAANDGGDVVALRTTRGFFVRDTADEPFRLQCLEYSGLLESESPDFVFAHGRLWVSTVRGLVSFDAGGCDRREDPAFPGVATFDISVADDGSLRLVTGQSGFANDVYASADGSQWEPLGLSLDGALLSRYRQAGDVWIASGLRFDPAAGGVVHVIREYADPRSYSELVVPTDAETFRVLVEHTRHGPSADALVVVDRFAESTEPDQLWLYSEGRLELLAELFELSAAQFGPDGAVYAGHAGGLTRLADGERTDRLPGVRVSGVYATPWDLFVMTEYAVDQFALGRWSGDDVSAELYYGELAGPVECVDAAGACRADWDDWLEEIPVHGTDAGGVDPSDDVAESDAGASGRTRGAGGCAAVPVGASPAPFWLAPALLLASRRRLRATTAA